MAISIPLPVETSDLPPTQNGWGPRIDGHKVRFWGTKSGAIEGARAIGWSAADVVKVHTRFQGGYAIAHLGGWLGRDTYGELWHDRNDDRS